MLHESLADYLQYVERLLLQLDGLYLDSFSHEAVSSARINIRFRLRSNLGHLLEVGEALGLRKDELIFLSYRYHLQDSSYRMIFRYDNSPHHRHISTFPHHKHLPSSVLPSLKPTIAQVLQEAADAISETPTDNE